MAIILLILLATVGLLDAAYLTYVHLFETGACGAGSGCGEVLGSPYATVLGTPLSGYGMGFYLAILVAGWMSLDDHRRSQSVRWISLLSIVASLGSLYLLYLQAVVIGAWCPFCMVSAAISFALLVISLRFRKSEGTLQPFLGPLNSRDLIPILVPLITIPIVVRSLDQSVQARTSGPAQLVDDSVVARIGQREITANEIDEGIRLKLYETRNQYREEWLDRQVLETAAEEKGVDVRTLVSEEVYKKIDVTEEEIEARYQEVKHRIPKNVPKASILPNIRNEIGSRKSKGALEAYVSQLRESYGTSFTVSPRERFSFDPNPPGGPTKGPENAAVTIVEFSDLECGYCSRAHSYLNELMDRRGDQIRIVFRHLPLSMHEHAQGAAEVAACAQEQNLFWPLVDLLFANQKDLERDKVLEHAVSVGVDSRQLQDCLDAGRGKRSVEADVADADQLGISSTPTFFINGHYVGSLPKDGLDALIDRELLAAGRF